MKVLLWGSTRKLNKYALIFLTILFIFGCSSSTKDESSKVNYDNPTVADINLNITKKVLKNGLTVVLTENRKLPLFSIYSVVKVGSRFESKGITGASHFLEHMMFKGSKNYAHGEFEKIISSNGGNHNAYTTKDLTVYYESLPLAALDEILKLEADRLFSLNLDEDYFQKERSVILEERKYRTENSPRGKLFYEVFQRSFEGTPYESPPIGYIPDLKSMTREQIYNYFKTFYTPENVVISIAGDFDADELMEKVEALFGDIPNREEFKSIKAKDSEGLYELKSNWGGDYNIKGESPLPMFVLTYPGYKVGSSQSYTLDILGSILGGGESSYLTQRYVYARAPSLSSIYAGNYSMERAGVFVIGGQLLKGKSLRSLKKNLKRDLKRVCSRAINEREVQKVKNQYLVSFFSSLETNDGLAELVGKDEAFFGNPKQYIKDLNTYMKISSEDVMSECQKLLSKTRPIFLTIWNKF